MIKIVAVAMSVFCVGGSFIASKTLSHAPIIYVRLFLLRTVSGSV